MSACFPWENVKETKATALVQLLVHANKILPLLVVQLWTWFGWRLTMAARNPTSKWVKPTTLSLSLLNKLGMGTLLPIVEVDFKLLDGFSAFVEEPGMGRTREALDDGAESGRLCLDEGGGCV
ncbi:hypothetical protein GQ457_05G025680 [Hibiscus cannabinus]